MICMTFFIISYIFRIVNIFYDVLRQIFQINYEQMFDFFIAGVYNSDRNKTNVRYEA